MFLKMNRIRLNIIFNLSFLFLHSFASAASEQTAAGEIIKIIDNKIYISSHGLEKPFIEGENVRVITKSKNRINIKITEIQKDIAIGEVESVYIPPFMPLEKITKGVKIQLGTPINQAQNFSFFLGANSSPAKSGYGGSQYFLGLNIHSPLNQSRTRWFLGLQADSLGKKDGLEIRKGSYMLGLGQMYFQTWIFFAVGIIDTMIINEAERDSGGQVTNPFTGTSIPKKGVSHDEQPGFQIALQHPILFAEINRNRSFGFSISPYLTYTQSFSKNEYGATTSLGISFDLLSE